MNTATANKKIIISFILGILIGGGSMWVVLSDEQTTPENITKIDSVAEVSMTDTSQNKTTVNDQLAGLSVFIDTVSFEKDGWVAIHEDSNGVPSNILGARLFAAGEHKDGVIDLLRGTMPDATYYAMLHSENGDRAFNIRNDTPLLGLDGQPIMATFRTLPK